jgi:endonuclease/exonuclease/phosphatase family metal-dependent hydrolase
MQPTNFTFCTWNAGTDEKDYLQLFENIDLETLNLEQKKSEREVLLVNTARVIAGLADVLALQEVSGNDRSDIQIYNKDFEIIRPPKNGKPEYASFTDTAIAINPRKFNKIENRSFNVGFIGETQFAVAVANERVTGKKIAFVSGHIAGFNLEETNESQRKNEAVGGDKEIEELINQLKIRCSDCDLVMIGTDINAIPEVYAHRFELFANAGFQLHRTENPTSKMSRNRHNEIPKLKDRELDYVFIKQEHKQNKFLSFLNNLFKKEKAYVTHLVVPDEINLKLDPRFCPSDHIPVFARVNETVKESVFYRFFAAIGSLVGRLKRLIY